MHVRNLVAVLIYFSPALLSVVQVTDIAAWRTSYPRDVIYMCNVYSIRLEGGKESRWGRLPHHPKQICDFMTTNPYVTLHVAIAYLFAFPNFPGFVRDGIVRALISQPSLFMENLEGMAGKAK